MGAILSSYNSRSEKENVDPYEQKFDLFEIPEKEYDISFSSSAGPGGQNVNRRATKATLIWNLWNSEIITEDQKRVITKKIGNRLTSDGDLIIYHQRERSQKQNKEEVIDKLHRIINDCLIAEKKRIQTNPKYRTIEKQRQERKKEKQKKEERQKGKNIKFEEW